MTLYNFNIYISRDESGKCLSVFSGFIMHFMQIKDIHVTIIYSYNDRYLTVANKSLLPKIKFISTGKNVNKMTAIQVPIP